MDQVDVEVNRGHKRKYEFVGICVSPQPRTFFVRFFSDFKTVGVTVLPAIVLRPKNRKAWLHYNIIFGRSISDPQKHFSHNVSNWGPESSRKIDVIYYASGDIEGKRQGAFPLIYGTLQAWGKSSLSEIMSPLCSWSQLWKKNRNKLWYFLLVSKAIAVISYCNQSMGAGLRISWLTVDTRLIRVACFPCDFF